MSAFSSAPKHVVVTGGGGFLGTAICKELLAQGYQVTSLSRQPRPHLQAVGIRHIQTDICGSADHLAAVIPQAEAIIHTAANPDLWAPYWSLYQTHVVGTLNLLQAARARSIPKFIMTSTPSVAIDATTQGVTGADESAPMPRRYLCAYGATKRIAEDLILNAHSRRLRTIALRPHLIFGRDDPHFLPQLARRLSKGPLRTIGNGANLVDVIPVVNAAKAHVAAITALTPATSGQALFLGQTHPVRLWSFIEALAKAAGLSSPAKRPQKPMSYARARRIGRVCDSLAPLLPAKVRAHLPLSQYLAWVLAHSHYFDHSKAHALLGMDGWISNAQALAAISTHQAQASRPVGLEELASGQ